jgi:hypothetical protein
MSNEEYRNKPRLFARENKPAYRLRYGDILKASQLVDLQEALRIEENYSAGVANFQVDHNQEGNSHVFVTSIKDGDDEKEIEAFGEYLVVRYSNGSGTGTFRIGNDVKVLTYSNHLQSTYI